ncbi:MAG: chemotaxis protein MotB, partial [Polyangiales bacterium]
MDVEVDEGGGDEGSPAWMATFADLCTLLLTFFVLLLSFAEMDVTEFKQMLGSVRDAFGVQSETVGSFEALSSSPVSLDGRAPAEEGEGSSEEDEDEDVEKELAEMVEAMGLDSQVEVLADTG